MAQSQRRTDGRTQTHPTDILETDHPRRLPKPGVTQPQSFHLGRRLDLAPAFPVPGADLPITPTSRTTSSSVSRPALPSHPSHRRQNPLPESWICCVLHLQEALSGLLCGSSANRWLPSGPSAHGTYLYQRTPHSSLLSRERYPVGLWSSPSSVPSSPPRPRVPAGTTLLDATVWWPVVRHCATLQQTLWGPCDSSRHLGFLCHQTFSL